MSAIVARVVHFLTIHLVGKKIKKITAVEDANVFGKVGITGSQFEAALAGKKVDCRGLAPRQTAQGMD
jgi:formamidopyrimidine-DNA glycosylase